jgi:hypothetical protein
MVKPGPRSLSLDLLLKRNMHVHPLVTQVAQIRPEIYLEAPGTN